MKAALIIFQLLLIAIKLSHVFTHVTGSPNQFIAGKYGASLFRVSHGCGRNSTTAINMTIPISLISVRPLKMPGWTIEIEKTSTTVKWIRWVAEPGNELSDDHYLEFGLSFKVRPTAEVWNQLSEQELTYNSEKYRPVFVPTIQECVSGRNSWTTLDANGKGASPAPVLLVKEPENEATVESVQQDSDEAKQIAIAAVVIGSVGFILGVAGVGLAATRKP